MPNYNIFIVDDDPQMVELMSAWLMAEGHSVASDTAGSTALPQIALQKPDAVLVDLMMAQVNGLELVGELRSRPESRDAAIVMVSARTDGLWADRALEAGADGFIHKPLTREEFVLKVSEFIEAKKL
jgi:CheY-like chemotaxis protein